MRRSSCASWLTLAAEFPMPLPQWLNRPWTRGASPKSIGVGKNTGTGEYRVEAVEPRMLLSAYTFTSGSLGPPEPMSPVTLDSHGDLFGTTAGGGTDGDGTVYEIPYGSSAVTTLANFDFVNGDGPRGNVVIDSQGNLFGTTSGGGSDHEGVVYEIGFGTKAITTLASFDGTDGSQPLGGLALDSSSNLFGTTETGGTGYDGTVYEIASGGTAITTLVNFDGTNGNDPVAGITLDASGDLFGTTAYGGTGKDGTVFEIPHGSGGLTTLLTVAQRFSPKIGQL